MSLPNYPPQGGNSYFGYQPPKKSRTGLWLSLVAVAALVTLIFTGFVSPGFFRDDDNSKNPSSIVASSPNSTGNTTSLKSTLTAPKNQPEPSHSGTSLEQIAYDMVNKIKAGDIAGAINLICPESSVLHPVVEKVAAQKPNLKVDEAKTTVPRSFTVHASDPNVYVVIGVAEFVTGAKCVASFLSF